MPVATPLDLDDEAVDRAFAALANRHRRDIVSRLASGPMVTPELGRHLDITKQALNKHMLVLEGAGLIERTMVGRTHQVALVEHQLGTVDGWVRSVRAGWEANLDRLGAVVAATDDGRQQR